MTLSKKFAKQTIIKAIQAGDFSFLTHPGITVAQAQNLVDKYYKLPLDAVAQEAVDAKLIADSEESRKRFMARVKDSAKAGDSHHHLKRGFGRYGFVDCSRVEKEIQDQPMVLQGGRVSAELYFLLGQPEEGGAMLGWSENKAASNGHSSWDKNQYDGQYLEVDSAGRISLKGGKPVLSVRNIRVDARAEGQNDLEEALQAIELGKNLVRLGLRDPSSRSTDPYISGRHYSSMRLSINSVTAGALSGHGQNRRIGPGFFGGFCEMDIEDHDLKNVSYSGITLTPSLRGERKYDGGLREQLRQPLATHAADRFRAGSPEEAQRIAEGLFSLALQN